MKFPLIFLSLSIATISCAILTPQTCEAGSNEICQVRTNKKGDTIEEKNSCCMYLKVLEMPDTSDWNEDELTQQNIFVNFMKNQGYPVEKKDSVHICQTESQWKLINQTSDNKHEFVDQGTHIKYKAYCDDSDHPINRIALIDTSVWILIGAGLFVIVLICCYLRARSDKEENNELVYSQKHVRDPPNLY